MGHSTSLSRIPLERFSRSAHRITESQNHRMVGIGMDVCGSSSPTPLPKQDHLEQATQDFVQAGFE